MDLITGATGFIGRHVALRRLARGRRVRVLCRNESAGKLAAPIRAGAEVAIGDLRDRASLERAANGAELVFHCAGHVSDWGTDAEFDEANVRGTGWLLDAAARAKVVRFVHLSSIAVFGVPSPLSFDDASPYGPGGDPYSRTKIAGETLVLGHALPTTVLRPAVVYGPHSTWVEEPLAMIRGRRMFLIGGGRGTCHPCYIENLLDAIDLAAVHPAAVGQAFIVGDDDPLSFRDYFNHLAQIAGAAPIARSIPIAVARTLAAACELAARVRRARTRPLLTQTAIDLICTPSQMSIQKIRDRLGYAPRYGVVDAMRELAHSYART